MRDAIVAGRDCTLTLLNYRKDGTSFWNDLSLAAVHDENGTLTHFVGIVADATERMRLEQALRHALAAAQESAQAKTRFLAMMSHELRTPLQAVLGYADFLLSPAAGPLTDAQREDIDAILQGARRMVRLIEQLLDLSRLEAGRFDLLIEPVHLAPILEQIRQDLYPQVEAKGIAFSIKVPTRLPPIAGDSDRIRQILLNIASNAVKFTDRGSVAISAKRARGAVAIAIRDTGIGIDPEQMVHIFDEFQQGDRNLARQYGGAGLGLAIARQLTNQMGGHISVTSNREHGSTFTVWLPIFDEGEEGEGEV
jgi:signal transduction histidine kinase